MMTKQQFDEKFDEIARKVPGMIAEFKKAALRSGALDLESEDDNYVLPKQVLWAALVDVSEQWNVKHPDARKSAINIRLCSYPDHARA